MPIIGEGRLYGKGRLYGILRYIYRQNYNITGHLLLITTNMAVISCYQYLCFFVCPTLEQCFTFLLNHECPNNEYIFDGGVESPNHTIASYSWVRCLHVTSVDHS